MYYIIIDLEWNNAFTSLYDKPVNEIIEIGAVKLDESLNIVDTFKQLISPRFSKKLSSRCKRITKITNDEIKRDGIPFEQVIADFSRWSSGDDNVFLSWSNSDLYVLCENFLKIFGNCNVNFMHRYCDAQKYCMSFIENENNNQISLLKCAEIFNIDVDTESLHRALTDCYVTAECLKKVFDTDKMKAYISDCDNSFFERLLFKPYAITNPECDLFSLKNVDMRCPRCNSVLKMLEYECTASKSFKCASVCKKCRKNFWVFVRAKKNYDSVSVSVKTVEMNKRKAKSIRH